jgi:hypothetical protein
MFTCDCCAQTIMDERPILRAIGYWAESLDRPMIAVERLCEGCDESLNEMACEDIYGELNIAHRN